MVLAPRERFCASCNLILLDSSFFIILSFVVQQNVTWHRQTRRSVAIFSIKKFFNFYVFFIEFFLCKMCCFFLNWLQQKSEYIKSFSCPLVSLYFLARCKLFLRFSLFSRCCCTNKHDNSLYRQKEKMDNHKKKINRFKCLTHFQMVFMAFFSLISTSRQR